LREQAAGEGHISVPLCLLCEHISKGRLKTKTAPGLDGVVWACLCSLPHKIMVALRVIFDARVNAYPCSIGVVSAWRRVLLHLIPKNQNPTDVAHWRPIALSSVFQKLYLSVACALVEQLDVVDPLQRGFRPGGQTMEVAEAARVVARKALEWGLPLYLLKADVARAFDNICHEPLNSAMARVGVPAKLRHAVFQELRCDMSFSCQGTCWEGVSPSKGGRQGGSETPTLWNIVLGDALRDARRRWYEEDLGWRFDRQDVYSPHVKELLSLLPPSDEWDACWLPYLAWADDLVIFGRSKAETERMWCILSDEIVARRLSWKKGSLELYRPGVRDTDVLSELVWQHSSGGWAVREVGRVTILGVLISETASDLDACRYRITQAWVHFMSRKAVLCSKLVPLHLRWSRMQETVMRTVLYGAGAWALTDNLLSELATFERKVLGTHSTCLVMPRKFHTSFMLASMPRFLCSCGP
jgi:hypothetical protein